MERGLKVNAEMPYCSHVLRLCYMLLTQQIFSFLKKNSQKYGTSPRQSGNVLWCRRVMPVRPCSPAHSLWIIIRSIAVFAHDGRWYMISQKSVLSSLYRVNLTFWDLFVSQSWFATQFPVTNGYRVRFWEFLLSTRCTCRLRAVKHNQHSYI